MLTTIQQLDPMHVDIVQSSAELLSLRRQLEGQSASRQVQLVLEDGSVIIAGDFFLDSSYCITMGG